MGVQGDRMNELEAKIEKLTDRVGVLEGRQNAGPAEPAFDVSRETSTDDTTAAKPTKSTTAAKRSN